MAACGRPKEQAGAPSVTRVSSRPLAGAMENPPNRVHNRAVIGDVFQRLRIRSIPPRVIFLTAVASYLVQLFAVLQGWPLWAIALVTLIPWLPLFTLEMSWTYRHYGWLALFYILVVTQSGHVGEHVAQMVQLHLLNVPPREARGIFGALDIEWVHFIWNSFVLIAVVLLLTHFRQNRWLWATLVFAGWHEFEHIVIMSTFLTTGTAGTPGLLSRGGLISGGTPLIRPDLHMLYNVVETVPLVAAFAVELRRARDVWLARALPRATQRDLAEASAKATPLRFRAGETICAAGDVSDTLYIIVSGECEALSSDGVPLGVMGPGEHFGEIGLLSGAPRTATVRGRTDVELLAMDWRMFRLIVQRSEGVAEDVRRVADERLATTNP